MMLRILSLAVSGMIIAGCATGGQSGKAGPSTDPQSVLNKTWQWESTITPVERIAVPTPERYTIFLKADG
ncbi:MAG: hypothetical protein PVH35_05290, partial [Syntrophobacterales bacterium]